MSEQSNSIKCALGIASDLEDDNFLGNTMQIVNAIHHLAEDCEGALNQITTCQAALEQIAEGYVGGICLANQREDLANIAKRALVDIGRN